MNSPMSASHRAGEEIQDRGQHQARDHGAPNRIERILHVVTPMPFVARKAYHARCAAPRPETPARRRGSRPPARMAHERGPSLFAPDARRRAEFARDGRLAMRWPLAGAEQLRE